MWPGHVIVGMFNGTNPMSYRFWLPNIDVPARGVTILAVRLTVILISGRPGWVRRIELVPVVISLSHFQSTQSDAIDKHFLEEYFWRKMSTKSCYSNLYGIWNNWCPSTFNKLLISVMDLYPSIKLTIHLVYVQTLWKIKMAITFNWNIYIKMMQNFHFFYESFI